MTTLKDFEYLIAYGTEIELFFTTTGEFRNTTVPNYGPNMKREVISIYPIDKNKLRISLGKIIEEGAE